MGRVPPPLHLPRDVLKSNVKGGRAWLYSQSFTQEKKKTEGLSAPRIVERSAPGSSGTTPRTAWASAGTLDRRMRKRALWGELPLWRTASNATVSPHDLGVSLEELFEVSDK